MRQKLTHINEGIKCITTVFFMLFLPCFLYGQVEICDNGIDDDNDGLIDLNDDDCYCEIIQPISLIPNPSFEETNCCPSERSELHCATDWIQASEPTTDFIHHCDWLGWPDFPPPLPFPDGDGVMGFRDGRVRGSTGNHEPYWKEYAGACLLSPLLKDSSYRFQFDVGFVDPQKSPAIDISFFGTSSCNFLPFGIGDDDFGCPSNSPNWDKLGEVTVSGGSTGGWVNTFIEITPTEDIYAIAIGPDCDPLADAVSTYYFFDNLLLSNLDFFDLQISEIEHPCSPDFALSVPHNPDFQYQWFLGGIALAGETFPTLTQNYGEGSYQVRILDGSACRLSTAFEYVIPKYAAPASISICEGDAYEFGEAMLTTSGSYIDTFQTENGCDSVVTLELTVIGTAYDTLEASILGGEIFKIEAYKFKHEGEYPLTFTSSIGCDSLVLLKLSHFDIYIPNAFTPNNDGVNDMFHPFAPAGKMNAYEMRIFDRWGNLLFEGTEWDGSNLDPGVYVYVINIDFEYGESKLFSGSITLLK